MAALAAEAAEDAPRALMIAAPRWATSGMNVPVSHSVVHLLGGAAPVDQRVVEVGVLGGGVVAPDGQVLDGGDRDRQLGGELRDRAVVVQPGHRGEPARGHVGRVLLGDQRVGVGRVADHEHLDVAGGVLVDGLALRAEDPAVGLQQVTALHARGTRPRADQQGDVGAVEGGLQVVGDVDAGQQREGAVIEFHRGALGRLQGRGDLQQPQSDRHVRPEKLSGSDAEQQVHSRSARRRRSRSRSREYS